MTMVIRDGEWRGRSRGQALAEFALTAPIFLFVMFALFELGRAVYYTQILDSAARDGARYAIVHGFESFEPSGPMPNSAINTVDPNGDNVIEVVEDRSVGVTDKVGSLITRVKWCDASPYQAATCGDHDPATNQPLACSAWSGLGDGDNNRGQIVTVCVSYSYQSILGGVVPIPDFTISGRASLVVNH
jgi:hypothetical protein